LWEPTPGARLAGKLKDGTGVGIPVAVVSREDGAMILESIGRRATGTISVSDGYRYSDGTSFATPHVSGSAVYVWKQCRDCDNADVESCLLRTARNLGDSNDFGAGLVQTREALQCLKTNRRCC